MDRLHYKKIDYKSLDIDGVTEDMAQHICINDTVDIIIQKEGNSYIVRVLDTPNSDTYTTTELIDYEDYSDLLGLED